MTLQDSNQNAAKSERALTNLIQPLDRLVLKFTSEKSQTERSRGTKYIDIEYWTGKFLYVKRMQNDIF